MLPILYSFRRCPYAMRARMALIRSNFQVELREVVLRNRPSHMMHISPKGTVPVLLLPDGTVIEESLEIMKHVLNWELSGDEERWVERNDGEFKYHLDRYKYPNRFEGVDGQQERTLASSYLNDLNDVLSGPTHISQALSDALFPFIRQFAHHDEAWFYAQSWDSIHSWLDHHLESEAFEICMKKEKPWIEGQVGIQFP